MTRSSSYSSRERNQKTRKKRTKKYRFARRSRREDHRCSGPSSKLWRNETGDGVLFRAHHDHQNHRNRKARCHSRERGRSFQSTRPSSSRVRGTTTPSSRHSLYSARKCVALLEKPPFTKKKKKKKKKKRRANNNNDNNDDNNEINESRNDAHNRGHHPRKSARRASTLVRWGFFAGKRAREREREKAFSIRYMSLIPSKRVSITNNEGKKRLRH